MEERIERLTNIKTIGWTTVIVFGTATLWAIFQLIRTVLFDSSVNHWTIGQEGSDDIASEMRTVAYQLRMIWLCIGGITLLTTVGAAGLIKLRTWGPILYQAITIVIIVGILGALYYYLYNLRPPVKEQNLYGIDVETNRSFPLAHSIDTIGYGGFMLLFAWMLTRANIFLSLGTNRREFQ